MGQEHWYHARRALAPGDPLLSMARLARLRSPEPYLIYEREGRWVYAGGMAAEILAVGDRVLYRNGVSGHKASRQGDPFRSAAELLAETSIGDWCAYGWVAFELAYLADEVAATMPDQTLLHLFVPRVEVHIDGGHSVVRAVDPNEARDISEIIGEPAPEPGYVAESVNVESLSAKSYEEAVADAVDEIRVGRLRKVIISRVVPVNFDVDLVGTYVVGRRNNDPRRSFLLNLGGLEAAGFSPETVVEVDAAGRVVTQPLAGTRALTSDPIENSRLYAELVADPKEIFEHVISVKLAFQELLQVCRKDTVRVEEFMEVEQRGSVQHLGSRLSGRLSGRCDAWDALAAVFPAVTVSGVPKTAAYACIRRHEPVPRGLYGGAVLTIDSRGSMDAAVALRTVFSESGRTWLRAGAGIVSQSVPAREFEETCEKLRSAALHLVAARPTASPETELSRPRALGDRS